MSFVQKNTNTHGTDVTSLSSSITGVTAGNLLLLVVSWANSGSSTGPQLDATAVSNGWKVGQNPTGTASTGHSGWFVGASIFYLPNTPSGTNAVNITFNNTSRLDTILAEFSGYATSSPLDKTATNNVANGTTVTVTTAATTVATELVMAAVATTFEFGNGNEGITDPPTGYTTLNVNQDNNLACSFEMAYKEVVATGTQSATWSWNQSGEGVGVISTFATSAVTDTLFGQALL